MARIPTEESWGALRDALTTFYWRKNALDSFLESQLGRPMRWSEEVTTKRDRVSEIIATLRETPSRNADVVVQMLAALAGTSEEFFELDGSDDPPERKKAARRAMTRVRNVLGGLDLDEMDRERDRIEERRNSAATTRSQNEERTKLLGEFHKLAVSNDPHARGRSFERLLTRLFEFSGLPARGAFSLEGEQIDGAVRFDNLEFLVEAKWTANKIGPEHTNHFKVKVHDKAHTTLGLMISINGFTEGAIKHHYGNSTRMLFLDGQDLSFVLDGRAGLQDVLRGKLRHAAQTGDPYYPASACVFS